MLDPAWIVCAAAAPYAAWRLRHDLHMLQLNSYRPERFARWMRANRSALVQPKEMYPLLAWPALVFARPGLAAGLGAFFFLLLHLGRPERPRKKPLVMTARARRALTTAAALALGLVAAGRAFAGTAGGMVAVSLAVALSPLLMLAASALVLPLENAFHAAYFRDAQRRIRGLPQLTVIGITGSYGKTSTKSFLQSLLSEHANSLMTPGSFNTPMGVAKVIREELRPSHRFFIAEMGAREPGNIAELCRLAQPKVAVVTAIGEQHLETFRTVEAIQRTKWELPAAVPADGLVVVCADDANIADMLARQPPVARVLTYGLAEGADTRAADITVGPEGSSFTLCRRGRPPLALQTRLLGAHNVANLCAAATVATELGVPDASLVLAVRRLVPPEHRLELRRAPGRYTVLDDAYNSNPAGAAAALDILRQMPCRQRILVTPGMVELGERQDELNRVFGRQAAACCDRILLVGPRQTRPIQAGVREAGFPDDHLHVVDDLQAAFALLDRLAGPEDVVLFENDLPDSYRG